MINTKRCIAIAEDGTWFSSEENLTAFRNTNPGIFTVSVGTVCTILDQTMLSRGTRGTVIGFDLSSKGKWLVLLKWNEKAAPIRVKIGAIMTRPPKKFWMVIPFDPNRPISNQAPVFGGNERRNGTSPAVHRFASREAAERYIADERRITSFDTYVLLEAAAYYSGTSTITM